MKQSECKKTTCEHHRALTLIYSNEELDEFFCKFCDGKEPPTDTIEKKEKPFSIYDLYSD